MQNEQVTGSPGAVRMIEDGETKQAAGSNEVKKLLFYTEATF